MLNFIKKESGFTFLEIIFSLVILSIIVAIAGMGIVTGAKGYLFARQNAHSAQKAQMALARIIREFQELDEITAFDVITYDATSVTFTRDSESHTIKLEENKIWMDDDILIDEIAANGFTLTDAQADLTDITIQIDMIRNDISDGRLTFSTSVHPKRIGH